MEQIIYWDEQLFVTLNNLGTSFWDPFWMFVTNKFSWIPLYIIIAYIFYRQFGWQKLIALMISIALMIATADQFSNLFKDVIFERLRPCYNPNLQSIVRLVKDSCGGAHGFISAHATNHFALAVLFSLIFQKYNKLIWIPFLIWAALIAYSRIYIGVHYPADVLVGAFFGVWIGYIYYQFYQWLSAKIIHVETGI